MKLKMICAVLMLPAVVFAGGVHVLTLKDAENMALEKNKSVEQAKEYINYLKGVYVSERSAALPDVSLYLSAGKNRDASAVSLVNTDEFDSFSGGVTVKQALFTWGKVGAAIKVAKIGLKTGDEQLRLYKQAVLRDVNIAFYDILLTKKMLEIAEQNVTQRQRHYEEAQKKFRLGTATDYDVLSAKVALKNAMPDVITYKNNLITAKDRLKYILGTDDDIDAEGSLGFNPEKTGDYDTLIKTAMEMRPEIRDKKLMVDVYREMVKIDSSDDKPRIDFKGSFDRTKMDGDTVYTGNTWNLGLTLSYNIFDGLKTSGKHTQAVSTLRRSRLQELQQVDSVSLELRQAISRLKEAEETIYAAEGTREEAARLLDMAEKGYSFGVKTKLEVDDAEFNLRSADVRLAQAYRNYKVSHVDLLWSAGILGEKTF